MRLLRLLTSLTLAAVACGDGTTAPADPDAPSNLTYQLIPSGDPNIPLGVLLTWDPPANGRAISYDVYGRDGAAAWGLRATTTSPTFHDAGFPQSEYYVVGRDGNDIEMGRSGSVTIDERNRLPAPALLTSVSMNGAIHLRWSDNVIQTGAQRFDYYRVYSALFDVSRGTCQAQWYLEGTTAGEAFYVGNLDNGIAQCFAVSAVSRDGHESLWSNQRTDTPRFDARNAIVYATAVRPDSAAFLFFDDVSRRVGIVTASSRLDTDVIIQRQADGTLWFAPARAGVTAQVYGVAPVPELTSIDRAPTSGFQSAAIEAVPGYGYVFRMQKADGVHYAAVRVAFVARDYVVFDWSYQSAPGNLDLLRIGN
jgi:hypothetical protein